MTAVVAIVMLFLCPVIVSLIKNNSEKRYWALVALGALPFVTNLPLIGYIYIKPMWNGVSIGISISLMSIICASLMITRQKKIVKIPFIIIFSVYFLSLILSVFNSSVWVTTVFVWWQFANVLLVFFAVGGESLRSGVRHAILTGFSLGLMYQAGHVIAQKMTGMVQAPGTMAHQNILGLMIELTVLPLIAAMLGGDRRIIIKVGIIAALICIAGSGSRATMGIGGGMMVLLVVLSLIRQPTSRKFRVSALGAIALCATAPLAIETLNERFAGGSYVTEESQRNQYENAAKAMASDYFLGVGANQYVLVTNRDGYADRANVSWQLNNRSVPVHNAYLLARAETGRMGEISFFLLILIPMITAFYYAFSKKKLPSGELMLGISLALAANMIHNNYEFAIHTLPVQLLLFINIALIATEWRVRKLEKKPIRKTSPATDVDTLPNGVPAAVKL